VIVVLALAAVLAAPVMADRDASRVQAAARLLTADLEFAQIDSISHADDACLVLFNQGAGSYSLARNSSPGTPITEPITGQPYTVQFGAGRAVEMAGVSIAGYSLGGDDRITFGRYGELDQTTPAHIQLQSGSFTLTIQIDPECGEVSVGSP
jgi:hypothetical protein